MGDFQVIAFWRGRSTWWTLIFGNLFSLNNYEFKLLGLIQAVAHTVKHLR